jgi:aryl-alcohol dehydrogenase-like predicted oxidoreductase
MNFLSISTHVLTKSFRKEHMGEADDPYKILDSYFEQGGNFIDTANVYQGEESEKTIGDWMEKRGNRDQMVIATKFSSAFRAHTRATEPIQTNLLGNSKKSMHVSVNASLKKLKTDYIDILYVHW